jgi:zinc transport system substrate-binding protein
VADAATGTVTVVDLAAGTVLDRISLAAPARLYPGADRSLVHAVQNGADAVAVIDSGIRFEDHGDHADLEVSAPALLPVRLAGPKPVHFNTGDGTVAVFFDGDGRAGVWTEAALREGRAEPARRLATSRAHHGVAKPVGELMALSVPAAEGSLPEAVVLLDPAGSEVGRVACPQLHGEGSSGPVTMFGCADGVALFDASATPPAARRIAYTAALPSGRMVRNLAGAEGHRLLVGDFGADGMVIVDPTDAAEPFFFVRLPAARMHFALDPEPGDTLFVLVQDGRLLKLSALTGDLLGEASVTAPYSMERGVVRPRVAAMGEMVLVSDPAAGAVAVLDAETLALRHRIAVGGQPFDVVVIGGEGHAH